MRLRSLCCTVTLGSRCFLEISPNIITDIKKELQLTSSALNLHIYKEENKKRERETKTCAPGDTGATVIHSHTPRKRHVMVCSYLRLLCARGRIHWLLLPLQACVHTHTHTRVSSLSCTHSCILLIVAFLLIPSGLINPGVIDPIMKRMM